METGAFQKQRRHERQQMHAANLPLSDKRAPLHYQVKSPDQSGQVQFWVSFKYVDFERSSNVPSQQNRSSNSNLASTAGGGMAEQHQQDVATSSNGYVIALFSYCMQFADPSLDRPANCKTTTPEKGFYPLLDEVIERKVATAAAEDTALDSNIWSKIRSSRAAEVFFESRSPHLLAIDVVDRSNLLDVPNARILFDEFDPDVVCSRLAPRLVRRSPILESLDVDESRGETCRSRRHALLKWMDTFRRSISRAHQMFASGSVEGAWSSSEGAFLHGLFLTRKTGNPSAPYALVAASPKYLSRLPYTTLVPTAASTPFGGGGGGLGGDGVSGGVGAAAAAAGGSRKLGGAGGGAAVDAPGQWTVEDCPIARIFTENAPQLIVPPLPPQPLDNINLPLGLLEVHCLFTPNTDVDAMGCEMFHALAQINAF
jgi:hypothetical protein